jgi:Tfp pilus assembly protein PilV
MDAVQLQVSKNKPCGISLAEVLVAMAIAGLGIFAAIAGFLNAATQAEGAAYALAAQCQALERLEQVRATKWDPNADPVVDQMVNTNFPVLVKILDIPRKNVTVYATNYTTITLISANPPLKMMRVDCVWSWMNKRTQTNTVMTYRGPDQ